MKEQELTDLLKLIEIMHNRKITNGIKLDVAAGKIAALIKENALLQVVAEAADEVTVDWTWSKRQALLTVIKAWRDGSENE